jgi:hypothetical protein
MTMSIVCWIYEQCSVMLTTNGFYCSFTTMFQQFRCLQSVLDIFYYMSSSARAPAPHLLGSQFALCVCVCGCSRLIHRTDKLRS